MTTSTQRGHHHEPGKPYSVTLWGSDPDVTDDDDCWTGESFDTRDEALACYRAIRAGGEPWRACRGSWEYVMVDGPDVHEVAPNPDQARQRRYRRDAARADQDWQREIATQAGMAHGCDAYNDAMGWS